jgi:quercetin dioxygenase-like cupin family protein
MSVISVVPAASGHLVNVLGSKVRPILTGNDTAGQFSLFEVRNEPGTGVPPHIHESEDELFHVLEGLYEIFLDGEWHRVGVGATVFGARGIPHGFRALTKGRLLVNVTPAGIEEMFGELSEVKDMRDFPVIARICPGYRIVFV